MSGIPVYVSAESLRVLVVGGGAVATRKVKQFAAAGAQVRIVSPSLSSELQTLVRSYAVAVEERAFEAGDIGDAQLIFAATNDAKVNEQIAREANSANRLVNVTDDAKGGQFSVMATHRRGPLTIAVNAGGVPAAALRIRDAIADRFDARYGDALDELVSLRRRLLAAGRKDDWRACADEVVNSEFCDTVEGGSISQRVAPWR